MITNNSTTVTCWLDSWGDGGCGISYFVIECRMFGRSHWNMIASHIASTERTFTVSDLIPATKYQLKITAYNNAGSTTAIYDFTTLTAQGCKMIQQRWIIFFGDNKNLFCLFQ